MKTRVVLFHPDRAEILTNPPKERYAAHPSYLINPDLSQVADLPPHRWIRQGNDVVPAPETEVVRREVALSKGTPMTGVVYRYIPISHHLLVGALSILISTLIQRFL